jgi:putative aldouronate transport system substrate-binding protein
MTVTLIGTTLAGCNEQTAAPVQPETKSSGNKLLAEPLPLKVLVRENPAVPILQKTPVVQEAFNKTNVQIQYESVPQSDYTQKVRTRIATNNIPDVMRLSFSDVQSFAKEGIFLNISDYLQYAPNFKALIEQRPEAKKVSVNGKLYGFPTLERYGNPGGYLVMLRMDLLKKLNLPMPTNFEEYYSVLKKFKEAYPDSIPFTNRNGTPNLLKRIAFPLGSGYGIYFEPKENRYVYGPASERFNKVISFVHRMYKEKLLDPDYAINTQQMWFEKLSSGKGLSYVDNAGFAERIFNRALEKADPNAKLWLVPPMKNDFGDARMYRYFQDFLLDQWAISSKVKDPIAAVKFFDWMYSPQGSAIMNYGIEGETFEFVNGKPKLLSKVIEEHKDKQDVLFSIVSAVGGGDSQIFTTMIDLSARSLSESAEFKELGQFVEDYTKKGNIVHETYNPPFNDEEVSKLKKLETQVNTLVEQEMDKFILGSRPIEDYDKFRAQLVQQGAQEIEAIYNAANKRLQ